MLSDFLQKLMFVKQFNMSDGKIEILGDRYVLLSPSEILSLQSIDSTQMYTIFKTSSQNSIESLINHAKVYVNIKDESLKNIAKLSKKIGRGEEGLIKTLQIIFDIYGLGKINITMLDNEQKRAYIILEQSSLAISHIKSKGVRGKVCTVTAGILAGIFSYIFEKDVNCAEEKCMAEGHDACYFNVSS
jgi:predicted hydrocarbon binding protein